jgi:sulfoxide reductase catalytic subunit YedY
MIIKIRKPSEARYSEVTPEVVYASRRAFMRSVAGTAAGVAAGLVAADALTSGTMGAQAGLAPLTATRNPKSTAADKLNTFQQITTYNNYYEFGTDKDDPARNAGRLTVKPWSVKVDGMVKKPATYAVEDLVDFKALEERVYRHRCVERWSMVIPWIGVSFSEVIRKVEPLPSAKYVEFTTLERPSEMTGQKVPVLQWPYVEALRMDEAMHPLAMMVVGLYGKVLPNQNGAPLRVHVPWKYGFKSGKSIVRLRFTDKQPATTWNIAASNEYGFYANVNPTVPHPRWSQAREVRLPGVFMNTPTQLFNGYADEVANLYTGMDLKKNY